ncbi:MAG TPA: DUF4331 family protein [Candidatus Kapabacteria bacterium]|nr:DUF4331 family protein [Candidatus Kapabacteria bacterium]
MKRLFTLLLVATTLLSSMAFASSHREAPLISNDPLADNTDLYAFRSPDDPTTVTIIANYIPFELPEGGPNYFTFGENIRYEIHIKNNAATPGDDITYRFTFTQTNEDPTTFFNIRLGKQNLKTTYTCQKSTDNGATWMTVVTNGVVPPTNIGPRSIDAQGVGLGKPYSDIMQSAITTSTDGAKVFCGPMDDPFFVDLAGIFDLGNFKKDGSVDALRGFNCHTIALKIPIAMLQKDHKDVSQAANILDGDFVIGVWASASRPKVTTLSADGSKPMVSSDYVQVSRLGMPLTNEAIIPIGEKDKWNALTPYGNNDLQFANYFSNPELTLYTGNGPFAAAVGTLLDLRVDSASLGAFDFRYGKDGLYSLLATNGGAGTALDSNAFGKILLHAGHPRSVDLLPIFYTGAPNLAPYQLATGKAGGNPLANGKPFINNFLPTLGDMLRLNMAVPVTDRKSPDFSSEGLIAAAVLGLTDSRFNKDVSIQAIPNMDGFPNGRRLEDDVTRIEMQAVGGLVLNAIGLWTDDYVPASGNPLTPELLAKVGWNAGVSKNDVDFTAGFPFLAPPHRGSDGLRPTSGIKGNNDPQTIGIRAPRNFFNGSNYPNPIATSTKLAYHLTDGGHIGVAVYDETGRMLQTIYDGSQTPGDYTMTWTPTSDISAGAYYVALIVNGNRQQTMKITVTK